MTTYQIYPFDKFENLKKIPDVNCPLLLIHGKKDELIPLWHGEKLFSAANEPKYFFQVEEGGHGTVAEFRRRYLFSNNRKFRRRFIEIN